MNRRTFLSTSAAVTGAAGLAPGVALQAAAGSGPREYYEWRTVRLKNADKVKEFESYLGEAYIPGLKRAGVGPVGVFKPQNDEPVLHVLAVFKSLDQFMGAGDILRRDQDYLKAAQAHMDAPATDPAYDRIESSLMVAFEGMAKLEVPAAAAGNQSRLFELRIYESHSRRANKKKIEMFNVGEIAIFRRTGLTPVFFGESIVGTRLPNLTYLLVFKDKADRDKNWGTFVKDPEWDKLKSTPGYADKEIVSRITNSFLVPAACSQV
jgi:hypothetical protein